MDVDLALLADAATIDGSGKLNILGVFDRIMAPDFPVRHGRVALVLRFAGTVQDLGRHSVEIRLRDPAGGHVLRLDGELQLAPRGGWPAQAMKIPHILNIDGIVFQVPGEYAFDVLVDGRHEASVPLSVMRAPVAAEA
ncbi:MAG: hypothetical protein HY704_14775 [Gemmatimonadetes bacterium]|nr:hypothetical protein [Gemmatimonadota bacterium]